MTAVLASLASRTQMRAGAGGVDAGPFGRLMRSSWHMQGSVPTAGEVGRAFGQAEVDGLFLAVLGDRPEEMTFVAYACRSRAGWAYGLICGRLSRRWRRGEVDGGREDGGF